MLKVNVKFFLGIQVIVWTAVAIISRLSWLGFEGTPPGWDRLATYSILGFLFSSALGAYFTRMYNWPIARQMLTAFLLTVLAALLWRVSYNAIEFHIIERGNGDFLFWGYLHWGRTSATQMLVWAGVFWALHYYANYNQQRLQVAAVKAQAQAAKLLLLQYQVNPHFLFNVLSGVDTLLLKEDVPRARLMIEKLSDYLRQTLEQEPTAAVPLDTEIERVENYLDIEKVRAGERLVVEWDLPYPLPETLLPNGILLPLVENAIKHGAINTRAGGYLKISVMVDGDELCILFENDVRKSSKPGFGIGLSNTRDRLETFYGGLAHLSVSARENVFSTCLTVPLEWRHTLEDT